MASLITEAGGILFKAIERDWVRPAIKDKGKYYSQKLSFSMVPLELD
jgi:hypothetical protein